MASRPLTPQAIEALAGIGGIAVCICIAGYLYFIMGTVPEVATPPSTYNLSAVKTELSADDSKNVFVKMGALGAAPYTSATSSDGQGTSGVQYTSDEIGKTDLTQLGK
jgi:hypothetical protein